MNDELNTRPGAFLIHDPAQSKSLHTINAHNAQAMLFRNQPNVAQAEVEYQNFLAELYTDGFELIELADIVSTNMQNAIRQNPNTMYTRDSSVTIPWLPGTMIISSMKEDVRKIESELITEAATRLGFNNILRVPSDLTLEGGDVFPLILDSKRTLLIHTGKRTSEAAALWLFQALGDELDQIALVQSKGDILHLDSALGFVGKIKAIIDEEADLSEVTMVTALGRLSQSFTDFIDSICPEVAKVSHHQADVEQQTNILNAGELHLVFNNDSVGGCRVVTSKELIHGRGGPRCLTRPIY